MVDVSLPPGCFVRDGKRLCCPFCPTTYAFPACRGTLHKHMNRVHKRRLKPLPMASLQDRRRASRNANRQRAAMRCGLAPTTVPNACNALLNDGHQRCKRKRVGTGLRARCFMHARRTPQDATRQGCFGASPGLVHLKESPPLGLGVFATVRLRPQDVITVYEDAGVDLWDKRVHREYREYILDMRGVGKIPGVQFPDLAPGMGVGSLVNSHMNVGKENVEFRVYDGVVYVVATSEIGPNQQLLAKYGPNFKLHKNNQ